MNKEHFGRPVESPRDYAANIVNCGKITTDPTDNADNADFENFSNLIETFSSQVSFNEQLLKEYRDTLARIKKIDLTVTDSIIETRDKQLLKEIESSSNLRTLLNLAYKLRKQNEVLEQLNIQFKSCL